MINEKQIHAAWETLNNFHVLAGRVTEFQVEAALRAALSPGHLTDGEPCHTCGALPCDQIS